MSKNESDARSLIMKVASKLLTSGPSPFREDYPKSVPNYIVKELASYQEKQRLMAIDLRNALDLLRASNIEKSPYHTKDL